MSRFGTMRIGGLALAVASLTALAACSSSSSSSGSNKQATELLRPGARPAGRLYKFADAS